MRGGRGVATGGDSELGRGLWPERCAGGLCQVMAISVSANTRPAATFSCGRGGLQEIKSPLNLQGQ